MKTIILISSIFFLLGLKISSTIDLGGKANAVDSILTNKIMPSKSVKALPLFNDSDAEKESRSDSLQTSANEQTDGKS